jgi:hypothetical protein
MKKIITFLACGVAFASQAQQTLLNGNFENWDSVVASTPSFWLTSERESIGLNTAVKTTDAYSGSAIRLETKAGDGRVAFGYFVNSEGDPTQGQGGTPYTQKPTSLNGYFKGTVVSGDSAVLLLIFKKNGAIISNQQFKFGESRSAYTAFNFSINLTENPDTVILAGAASNVVDNQNPPIGSIAYFDELSFDGVSITEQLPNSNFDSWETTTYFNLQNWTVMGAGDEARTTDAYKGRAAVKLSVQMGGDKAYGSALFYGTVSQDQFNGQAYFPYTKQNDTLVFYYKYTQIGGDTAVIFASCKKDISPIGGAYVQLQPTNVYTRMEVPITSFQAPDSLMLGFGVATGNTSAHLGSVLIIDEVTLKSEPLNTTGLAHFLANKPVLQIYPNPCSTTLAVLTNGQTNLNYIIYDLNGKIMQQNQLLEADIPTSTLVAGMYVIQFYENNQLVSYKRFIKQD